MTANNNGKSAYVPLRIPHEQMEEIEKLVKASIAYNLDEPYTVSSWIKKAIQEKLDHLARSKKKKPKTSEVCQMLMFLLFWM